MSRVWGNSGQFSELICDMNSTAPIRRQTAVKTLGVRVLRAFGKNVRGNIALAFGMSAGVLAIAAAGAVDYATMTAVRSDLQAAADSAATAAARELYIIKASDKQVDSVAKSIAAAKLLTEGTIKSYVVTASVNKDRTAVTAKITSEPEVHFSALFGNSNSTVSVEATAQILGTGRICMIGLETSKAHTISLEKSAHITANKCSVFSNSSHQNGIKSFNSARLTSELTCSAGGVQGSTANFKPQPEEDCPAIPDPLSSRPAPPVGGCSKNNLTLDSGLHTLFPGVYCGGLKVTKTADVKLKPGVYVIKDGPLIVEKTAKFVGDYVGFYFTGDKATLKFTKDSVIDIGAPKDGPMAGLLMMGDRNNKAGKKYRIESNNARTLLGTIYLPKGDLEIEANNPVADKSAYTVVVALGVKLSEGPEFVLNSDYSASDVPVPPGVGPIGGNIVLTK